MSNDKKNTDHKAPAIQPTKAPSPVALPVEEVAEADLDNLAGGAMKWCTVSCGIGSGT
jgi:hypothetical protein